MSLSVVRGLTPAIEAELRTLLADAFTDSFTQHDWQHALGGWHVLLRDGAPLVAHAAVVPRELHVGSVAVNAGYVEAVAAVPQRRGAGTAVMREVGEIIRREFAMGALSTGEHGFYERLGWERWQGPSYVRHGEGTVRSAEEDDGIMVLRFCGTAALDLAPPISCEARTGDDW